MTEKPRIYTYYIIAVLVLVTAAVSARAQEPADSVSQLRQDKLSEASRQAMGIDFDPFDYRLQNRHLERGSSFVSDSVLRSSHLAVNLFSGLPIHAVQYDRGAGRFSKLDCGRQFGMGLQYDLSRLHGLRLSYANTSYRRNPEVNGTLTVNEVQAGYLFNLTNYFRGFDPKRRFGVQATLGAAAGLVSDGSARSLTARADIGLLFRYRVLRHLSLFAEPYLGVAADNYDLHGGVHGYDFVSGVRAGAQLETSFANDLRDHIASHRTDLYKPARWFQNFYVG
ncbi:MAG: hypothetical protein HUK02_09115, partial [Bacteroidaceae bacterium]|nr:hypothetical protein [Bacteroidaceae bacterium]